MKKRLKEIASGGSVGAGSIANARGSLFGQDMRKRDSLKGFLRKFYSRTTNKLKMQPVPTQFGTVKEAYHINEGQYDLNDVVSRLKGIENSDIKKDNTVSYGVEDDKGNIMKVSVKKDQAKEFEYKLARDMADAKENNLSGATHKTSLAELLYNLKDEFDIVDVEFPNIPKDVIYNADKVSKGPDTSEMGGTDDIGADEGMDDEMGDQNQDFGTEDDEGGFGDEGMDDEMGGGDLEGGESGEGMEGEEGDMGDEELEPDDESVEDFEEEPETATPESILQSVMDMLKADAEAKKAQADAEAEKARAQQAEYSYRAAQATVSHEEEFARMETEAEEQKQKQKDAKRLANMAKYRVQKTSGLRESFLEQIINELDDTDTTQSIQRERVSLRMKFKIEPTDNPQAANYKKQMFQQANKELDDKLKAVKIRDGFNVNQRQQQQNDQLANQNQATNQLQALERI